MGWENMNPKEKLESILKNEYESEDEDLYKVELLPGMTEVEITEFKKQLPNNFTGRFVLTITSHSDDRDIFK